MGHPLPDIFRSQAGDQLVCGNQPAFHEFRFLLELLLLPDGCLVLISQGFQLVLDGRQLRLDLLQFPFAQEEVPFQPGHLRRAGESVKRI